MNVHIDRKITSLITKDKLLVFVNLYGDSFAESRMKGSIPNS